MCLAHSSAINARAKMDAAMAAVARQEYKAAYLRKIRDQFPDAVDFHWSENHWRPVFWGESRTPKVSR